MYKNLQWHPAFCYAMRLEFRYEQGLEYTDEFNLTDKPLMIDLMIVRKSSNVPIKNKIGHIFKGHNIVEYKSPMDKMKINTFYDYTTEKERASLRHLQSMMCRFIQKI